MKKLKLLLASILALIMALGVTACGDGGDSNFKGDFSAQANEAQVQNLAEKIEGKAQASDIMSFEMEMKQSMNIHGMKTDINLKMLASGTSAENLKMSGSGTTKVSMQGEKVKGTLSMFIVDGWMYAGTELAGYAEKYKMKVYDHSTAASMAGGATSVKDLKDIINGGGELFIDEQEDGTTKIKAIYTDKVTIDQSLGQMGVDMTAYFILDAEGNTTAIKIECAVEMSGVELDLEITMTAKDVTVQIPSGLATDSSYELIA